MRPLRHLSPRYINDRIALMLFEKTNPDLPWLTRDMIEFLDRWLSCNDIGLEFGSGRSTYWLASRCKFLTSVEDNPKWYEIVKNQVATLSVDYRYCEDDEANPNNEYVSVAKQIEVESLDFCLVDGKSRDHCTMAILDKLKIGGILIIDNVNRYIPLKVPTHAPESRSLSDGYASPTWEQVGQELSKWRSIWTTNGVTDTALWVKPA